MYNKHNYITFREKLTPGRITYCLNHSINQSIIYEAKSTEKDMNYKMA